MKLAKTLISCILCSVLLLLTAVGCDDSIDAPVEGSTDTTAETAVTSTEATSATNETESENEPDNEPDDEPDDELLWVVEPGKFDGDIQPVFDLEGKPVGIGLSVLDNKYLIDYEGNAIFTLPDEECYSNACVFCNICGVVDFGSGSQLSSDTYEVLPRIGHGLEGVNNLYLYDQKTGDVGYYSYGDFIPVKENIPFRVVALAEKCPATEEDYVNGEFFYERKGLYGILVDSELVVPFEYDDYINYSNGITALRKDGKWAYFDAEGKMILQNLYSPSSAMKQNSTYVPYGASSGYLALNLDGKWGFADTDGNTVTDFIFEEARPAFFGMAWVKTDAGWGVLKLEECKMITEEEAIAAIEADAEEMFSYWGLKSVSATRIEKEFYEYKGLAFSCTAVPDNGTTYTYDAIVSYDGTIICHSDMNYS